MSLALYNLRCKVLRGPTQGPSSGVGTDTESVSKGGHVNTTREILRKIFQFNIFLVF